MKVIDIEEFKKRYAADQKAPEGDIKIEAVQIWSPSIITNPTFKEAQAAMSRRAKRLAEALKTAESPLERAKLLEE